ncbi:MAG: exopolysaccharide biosynthesis protein [Verrucomicrobia bacterium]|nr:exopolysaccharide biosynthesis protein [Verrucomicrobiota bacterium]
MRHKHYKTLAEDLENLTLLAQGKERVSIKEILKNLPAKGRTFVLVCLSLPFCQPIHIPGLSILVGLIIAFIGIRMAFGQQMWAPKKILLKTISSTWIKRATEKILNFLRKLKRLTHPRMEWLCQNRAIQLVNGGLIVFLGLFLALPWPVPFIHLLAAWPIFLIAFGLLQDDGLFVLIGEFLCIIPALVLFSTELIIKTFLY